MIEGNMITRNCRSAAVIVALLASLCSSAFSAEKRPLEEVDIDALTSEAQLSIGSSQDEFNLVWIIPSEFWAATFAQDATIPEVERRAIMEELNKYVIVGVVRAEISPFGAFRFHPEMSVFNSLHLNFVTAEGTRLPINVQQRVNGDAQVLIDTMKPVLRASLGEMGDNFHLFVCENSVGREGRQLSGYDTGTIQISLDRLGKNTGGMKELAFPLDSLHVPRDCPQCDKPSTHHLEVLPLVWHATSRLIAVRVVADGDQGSWGTNSGAGGAGAASISNTGASAGRPISRSASASRSSNSRRAHGSRNCCNP